MDAADLARWRLAAQGLSRSGWKSPEDVARCLGASQAQDLMPGRWSLAQRSTTAAMDRAIEESLDDGRLLRTHVLRPTWHVVSPDTLHWLLAATAPRVHQLNGTMYRQVGVDAELMLAVRPLLEARLRQGHATRAQLAQVLSGAGIAAEGTRLAYVVMYAELEGWICSGRRQGSQQTYALVDERVPDARPMDREAALSRLADVYFTSRGPATVKDFATWASLTLGEARRAISAVEGLEELMLDGSTFLVRRDSAPPPPHAEPVVSLVQTYDEIVMSYTESRDVLTRGAQLWDLPARTFMHPLLVDGQLAGHWRYERDSTGRPAVVRTRLTRELDADERSALEGQLRRFGEFVGQPVEWR